MKVTHLISGLRGGGAEHLVLGLCKEAIADSRMQVQVVVLSHIDDISKKFRRHGIDVRFPASNLTSRFSAAINAMYSLMKEPTHVIHAHMFYACIAACIIKVLRPGTKLLFTLHNSHQPGFIKKCLLFVTKPLRDTDIIFPGLKPKWYQRNDAVAIANGIDYAPFETLPADKPAVFTCLFVGRLTEQKNPLYLVDIATALRGHFEFRIRVAGEGPLRMELGRCIKENRLESFFELTGYRDDIPALLAGAHCLLLPSKWEGMPLIVLEAAAAGTPVVATDTGNLSRILNEYASIVPLGDFPTSIIHIKQDYAAAAEKARQLSVTVRSRFSIKTCYEQHVSLWSTVSGNDK